MSDKLKINYTDQNTIVDFCETNKILENDDEWTEDVGGFWDDEVPEISNQSDTESEPISIDEINHIKVNFNNHLTTVV